MSYESDCCSKNCSPVTELKNCEDSHFDTFCPQPCFQSSNLCMAPAASNCCTSPCTPKSNPCAKRYQLLKHVARCPPLCPPKCKTENFCGVRENYKPIATCKMVDPCALMCFETNYTKSFNQKCCNPCQNPCESQGCCCVSPCVDPCSKVCGNFYECN